MHNLHCQQKININYTLFAELLIFDCWWKQLFDRCLCNHQNTNTFMASTQSNATISQLPARNQNANLSLGRSPAEPFFFHCCSWKGYCFLFPITLEGLDSTVPNHDRSLLCVPSNGEVDIGITTWKEFSTTNAGWIHRNFEFSLWKKFSEIEVRITEPAIINQLPFPASIIPGH